MYAKKNFRLLPVLMLLFGGAGLLLRLLQNVFGTERSGLLTPLHPTSILLAVLVTAATAVALYGSLTISKTEGYQKSFPGSLAGAVGHGAAALGIWYTVWPRLFAMEGKLGIAWTILGLAAVVGLCIAGWSRLQGGQPFFLWHLLPTLFLVVHIILHYQVWSSDPQIARYFITLMGLICLMFFSFYHCAFDVGLEWRGKLTFFGLISVCLGMAASYGSAYPWMYLGYALWALTDRPAPASRKRRRRPTMETEEEPQE